MRTDMPPTIHLADYCPASHLIEFTDLEVNLFPDQTEVVARLTISRNPANPDHKSLRLDGEDLQLQSLSINGEPYSDYEVNDAQLIVHNLPFASFVLETKVLINPAANSALSGLYLSNGNYCTQCEAEGFRRITYYLDRPDVLSRYRVKIEGDRKTTPVLLANGNPVDIGDVGEDRHYAVWEDPFAKPCYLFALVAGDLAMVKDGFTTMSGRKVSLRIFVEPGKQDRCDFAMEALKKSMRWDEERFGCEYDLDIFMIVAVSDFNMGAMENKGLNVFNDKYILARHDTATDQDYANIEAIIAHEYFHNWTGNRITCRDWFQLCLKEGLTVFRDQEFTSDLRSRPVKRISDVRTLRAHQFPEDSGPLSHSVRPSSYIEINNFYTATVYEKGAELVRMLQTLIGMEAFDAGMQIYFDRHDGDAATVEDFITCMAEASNRDLSQFACWYEQAGTPQVVAQGRWLAAQKCYELSLSQSLPKKSAPALHIPLIVGLIDATGRDLKLVLEDQGALDRPLIELTEKTQTYRFMEIDEAPVLSLNRGFSAPINLQTGQGLDELLFLLAHDSDSFNSWDAAQTAARMLIIDKMESAKASKARKGNVAIKDYVAAMAVALDVADTDPAFATLLLTMPSEADIAGHIGDNVDPDKIFVARRELLVELGRGLQKPLQRIWDTMTTEGDYSPDAGDAAKRAVRAAALTLLCHAAPDEWLRQAHEMVLQRANMSEEMAGLGILNQFDCQQRDAALELFYERYKDDHLLLDKWFSMQAVAPLPTTVESVKKLMSHKDFSLTRPNRVRALVASFVAANQRCFNQADGAGYDLLAEVVIALDKINPQVAARLATSFRSWRMLEPNRSAKAQKALQGILSHKQLSRDTIEIIDRTLT